jgi:hypothetical protein
VNSMPEPTNSDDRITGNPDFRDGYAQGFVDALTATHEQAVESTPARNDMGFAERFLEQQRQQRLDAAPRRNFCSSYRPGRAR